MRNSKKLSLPLIAFALLTFRFVANVQAQAIVFCGDEKVVGKNLQGKYEECDHGKQNGVDGICDANCQYVIGDSIDPACYQAKDDACQAQFAKCLSGNIDGSCMGPFQDCLAQAVDGCNYPIKVGVVVIPSKDEPKDPQNPDQPQPQPQPDQPEVKTPPDQVASPVLELSGSKMGCSLEVASSRAGDLGIILIALTAPLLRRRRAR